ETPALRALNTRQPVFVRDRAELVREFGESVSQGRALNNAWAVLPCRSRGATLGVLSLAFPDNRPVTAADRATLATMADLCGQALERTRLLEEERVARVAAERRGEWARFHAQAADMLTASLDE